MAKYIAHASIDERGKISGGTAGDGTKKEVCIRTWYNKPWNVVLRIKDEAVRIQFANNMIDLANNDYVGYDQNQRNTLLTQAKKVDFDFSKIKTKCECDCSSAITICYLGAVYKVHGKEAYEKAYAILVVSGNCATTSTLRTRFNKLNAITVFTSNAYIGGTSKALYGDIYNKEGSHVVAYIDDGCKLFKTQIAVDGVWGKDTTRRLQEVFGTPVDGIVSNQHLKYMDANPGLLATTFEWKNNPGTNGSSLIKAIQRKVGVIDDGFIGPKTIKAMQKWLGSVQDGCVSKPSGMVKALQKWLNKQ